MPDDDEVIQRAAAYLAQATHILIGAGAGMSADSGLRTYADAMHEAALARWHMKSRQHMHCQSSAIMTCASPRPSFSIQVRSTTLDGISAELPPSRAPRGLSDLGEALRLQGCGCHMRVHFQRGRPLPRFQTLRARLHEIHGCVEEWMCSAALGYTSIAEGSAADDEGMTWHSRGGVFESHNLAVENAAREHAQASSSGGGGGEGGGGGSTLVALGTPWRAECSTYLVTPPSGDAVVAGGGAVAASDGRNNEGRR